MLQLLRICRYNIISSMQPQSQSATGSHCKFCFDTLNAKLQNSALPKYPPHLQDFKVPIFVTWLLDGELRGCIGTFQHEKLSKVLGDYALISALQDDRFDPISPEELPGLSVGVSFLVNFKPNLGAYDWEVGKNGIILEVTRNNRKYSGTFLPEVAEEEKWDKKTTLKHLLQKAGCKLPLEMVESDIKITSYESSKAKLSYQEWKQWDKK